MSVTEKAAGFPSPARRRRVVILGAAGRDFHDFNLVYRDDPAVEVLAFTATQIPGIEGRRYPASLAGRLYPEGIPIVEEHGLEELCRREGVDEVVFAYSDVSYEHVMQLASRALATGADFTLLGPARTSVEASVPVLAVSAVRTGCGKSQVARWLSRRLRAQGRRVVAVRHPMPYGVLSRQAVQRLATLADLDAAHCTLEEREEYEPHLAAGNVVFAGIDYAAIVRAAEAETDVLLWDGGNNDIPFVAPDLHIVLVDPYRVGDEGTYYPGAAVLRMADIVVVTKTDSADPERVERAEAAVREVLPGVPVLRGRSPITLDDVEAVRGRRVLVVEDGPTVTHGGMPWGAGYLAARAAGAAELVDPRASAAPSLAEVYRKYPHLGPVLPAMGYSDAQLEDLRKTIESSEADLVVVASPIDLAADLALHKPVVRARYEYDEDPGPDSLGGRVDAWLASLSPAAP